jgi:predicted transglutaminase-like cysteine proteinase
VKSIRAAAVFAAALSLVGVASCSTSRQPLPPVATAPIQPSPLPLPEVVTPRPAPRTTDPDIFGSTAVRIVRTPTDAKWHGAERETGVLPAAWQAQRARLSRLRGLEQLAAANAWVNHAVAQASDRNIYGQSDHWASLGETAQRGRGDCEDYAIAKMQLLKAAGVDPDDLFLAVVYDLIRRSDHAFLLVRLDGAFYVLDSPLDRVMPEVEVRDYRPIVTFSAARTWIHGYRESPVDFRLAGAISPGGN